MNTPDNVHAEVSNCQILNYITASILDWALLTPGSLHQIPPPTSSGKKTGKKGKKGKTTKPTPTPKASKGPSVCFCLNYFDTLLAWMQDFCLLLSLSFFYLISAKPMTIALVSHAVPLMAISARMTTLLAQSACNWTFFYQGISPQNPSQQLRFESRCFIPEAYNVLNSGKRL